MAHPVWPLERNPSTLLGDPDAAAVARDAHDAIARHRGRLIDDHEAVVATAEDGVVERIPRVGETDRFVADVPDRQRCVDPKAPHCEYCDTALNNLLTSDVGKRPDPDRSCRDERRQHVDEIAVGDEPDEERRQGPEGRCDNHHDPCQGSPSGEPDQADHRKDDKQQCTDGD